MRLYTAATLQIDGDYQAAGNAVDSFTGDGSTAWPPVDATKTISGTAPPFFDIAKFMNGAGQVVNITNTQGIFINNQLDFANGITTTVRSNTNTGAVKFNQTGTYTNTALDDAQHVNGYVLKTGSQAFTFPVGSGTDLRTLAMSAPATVETYSVAWIAGNPDVTGDPSNANAMHSRAAVTSPISSVSLAGQWDWIPVLSSTGVGLTITASIPDVSSTGVLPADLRLVGWNGTSWVDLSGGPNATGNTEGSTLSGTMIAGIQAIGIGSTSVVLPVTFSSFTVQKQGCTAVLNWSTDMEHNNRYFAVERGFDGKNFTTIAQVTAAGNSTEKKFYSYTDSKPAAGLNQYRIAQVDIDGKRTTTGVQALYFNCATQSIKVYPNPATRTVNIEAPEGSKISVYNIIGQRIEVPATSSGHLSVLDVSALAAGNYTIHILDASGMSSHKLTVVK
ncbi:MAG: T9SS type A sorting domain-containing protein [Taibaiella sp.]